MSTLFNIPGAMLSDADKRFSLLLVGEPFTGKSTAAATFPDAVFLDFDHKAPKGATIVPFWDASFCDRYAPRTNPNNPPNQRDALLMYVSRELKNIPPTCTVVLDSMTAVEAAFHLQTERVETIPIGRGGKEDSFHVWKEKMKYLDSLVAVLKTFPGKLIVIMHEQPEKNEAGFRTGGIKPLMTGNWIDKVASHFTLMFRQRIVNEDESKIERASDGISPAREPKRWFVWDVLPTRAFASNNTLGITKTTIEASWENLQRHANLAATPQTTEISSPSAAGQ